MQPRDELARDRRCEYYPRGGEDGEEVGAAVAAGEPCCAVLLAAVRGRGDGGSAFGDDVTGGTEVAEAAAALEVLRVSGEVGFGWWWWCGAGTGGGLLAACGV